MNTVAILSEYLRDFPWFQLISATGLTFLVLKVSQHVYCRLCLKKILLKKHEQLKEARANVLECIPHDAKLDELCELTTRELGQKLRSKEVKPSDILRAFQRRTADLLPQNCVAEVIVEASQIAEKLNNTAPTESPLFGIPVSIKERIPILGYDCPYGLVKNLNSKAEKDAVLVSLLRSAGAIPFVSTSMPPTGLSQDSSNAIYGEQVNPFDSSRLTGGSSGGEAVLLVGGGSPLGFGSDIGGSLRIPAAFCGIASLKPTFKRVSQLGLSTSYKQSILHIDICLGPMSKHVDSLVDAMRCLLVPEMYSLDTSLPPLPFDEKLFSGAYKKSLVIGYYTEFGGTLVPCPTPAVIRAVHETKAILEKAGHRLVEFKIPNPDLALRLFFQTLFADSGKQKCNELAYEPLPKSLLSLYLASEAPAVLKRLLGNIALVFGIKTFGYMLKASAGFSSSVEVLHFLNSIVDYEREFAHSMQVAGIDLLIGPVCAFPAPSKDSLSMFIDAAVLYTSLYNLLDYPAGVVPVGRVTRSDVEAASKVEAAANNMLDRTLARMQRGSEGLPLAVQVIAPPFREESVLRVMKEIEMGLNFWMH